MRKTIFVKIFTGYVLIIALMTNGHVLMEGLPGTAKTRSINTLSNLIDSEFSRVQFTPDLLPADILGVSIYHREDGSFRFHPEFAQAVTLINDRTVDLTPLISATYGMDGAVAAFELASDRSRAMKVQLKF